MKNLHYIFLTMLLVTSGINMVAQSGMTIKPGGAVTINGNTIIANGCGNPITDTRDGKVYTTVLIGNQCWMAQNINYGGMIPGIEDQNNNNIQEKYCYDNLESNCTVYGGLYQWNEAMQYSTTEGVKGICPTGWHLPTDAEWTTLTTFLGGEPIAGGKMKEAGTTHWVSPNTGATNSSGFTGLPGGARHYGRYFNNLTGYAYFWSSSQYDDLLGWSRALYDNLTEVGRNSSTRKAYGFSVRCIKD